MQPHRCSRCRARSVRFAAPALALLHLLCSCALAPVARAQALPPLPELPSPSPMPCPSPLPSAIAALIESPSPSPQTVPPTAVPVGVGGGTPPAGAPASEAPTPAPGMSPRPPAGGGAPGAPPASPSPTPTPSPRHEFIRDGVCVRDATKPRPVLGRSQARNAVCTLVSAGAVALASMLYGLSFDWRPREDLALYRVIFIVLARLLIITSIKISAALVAVITKASPDDGALDASGAFLTWGSAIFTRLFYEGLKMTLAALEFTQNESVWDDRLRDFLTADIVPVKIDRPDADADVPLHGSAEHGRDALPPQKSDELEAELNRRASRTMYRRTTGPVSLARRVLGGRFERKLVLVTAVLYFAMELSVLSTNILELVGAFADNPDRQSFFSTEESGGQCGLLSSDAPLIAGILGLQGIYLLTQQPSLVPVLTISAFTPQFERAPKVNALLRKTRWIVTVVLVLWMASLLTMPLFAGPLIPLFTAGDISLFWYVLIAPSVFSSTGYIITATYTCFAGVVGLYIIYNISKVEKCTDVINDI